MSRWNELIYGLGFNILLPRFCLFVLLPCLFFFYYPQPPASPWLLRPGTGIDLLTICLLYFGLSVAANLSISRYLRLHHTPDAPYHYDAASYVIGSTGYFRIRVTDTIAFRRLERTLKRDHRGQAIWFWLWVDDLVYAPPILLIFLIGLLFLLVPLLITVGWKQLTHRKPSLT